MLYVSVTSVSYVIFTNRTIIIFEFPFSISRILCESLLLMIPSGQANVSSKAHIMIWRQASHINM